MSIIIGIDHGYYAIKTAHCSFAAGLTSYGEHEPYTRQGLLEFGGCFFVCGSGRQPIQRDKTINAVSYTHLPSPPFPGQPVGGGVPDAPRRLALPPTTTLAFPLGGRWPRRAG